MQNNSKNNNTEDKEEFFEVGSYFHSQVYSQLRSILRCQESKINDYIEDMRDVTGLYEYHCITDILTEGFVTREDMLEFTYRLKQCIKIDKDKGFGEPVKDKEIHKNMVLPLFSLVG